MHNPKIKFPRFYPIDERFDDLLMEIRKQLFFDSHDPDGICAHLGIDSIYEEAIINQLDHIDQCITEGLKQGNTGFIFEGLELLRSVKLKLSRDYGLTA